MVPALNVALSQGRRILNQQGRLFLLDQFWGDIAQLAVDVVLDDFLWISGGLPQALHQAADLRASEVKLPQGFKVTVVEKGQGHRIQTQTHQVKAVLA